MEGKQANLMTGNDAASATAMVQYSPVDHQIEVAGTQTAPAPALGPAPDGDESLLPSELEEAARLPMKRRLMSRWWKSETRKAKGGTALRNKEKYNTKETARAKSKAKIQVDLEGIDDEGLFDDPLSSDEEGKRAAERYERRLKMKMLLEKEKADEAILKALIAKSSQREQEQRELQAKITAKDLS